MMASSLVVEAAPSHCRPSMRSRRSDEDMIRRSGHTLLLRRVLRVLLTKSLRTSSRDPRCGDLPQISLPGGEVPYKLCPGAGVLQSAPHCSLRRSRNTSRSLRPLSSLECPHRSGKTLGQDCLVFPTILNFLPRPRRRRDAAGGTRASNEDSRSFHKHQEGPY